MDQGPARIEPPNTLASDALSQEELDTVTQLLSYLQENSFAYESHIQLINLLHKGLLKHLSARDGTAYSLLTELRQAREAMDSRFAVGENIWLDWLSDEVSLASTTEERLAVTELFQKAVHDEPVSVRIWQTYLEWLESNYATCYDISDVAHVDMSAEDKQICRELFTKEMLYETQQQAALAVKWRIDTSHVIWSKYLYSLTQQGRDKDGSMTAESLEQTFIDRLQTPHIAYEETKGIFWPIISERYGDRYEEAMEEINQRTNIGKEQVKMRSTHEDKVQAAVISGDRQRIVDGFNKYLKWEKHEFNKYLNPKKSHQPRSPHNKEHAKELRSVLYERALLHLPSYADWWVEYIDFVISQSPSSHNPSSSVLPLIERATRHCPWSGELWARRILRCDYERRSYDEIEATKHLAVNSGLSDVGGLEELLKMLVEWCSYLRRQAFSATATEDNKDMAEVGITMAIEDVQQVGKKLYGEKFEGDPSFRLEAILIKFLGESRRVADARAVWQSLVPSKRNSYEFWQRWHGWEITIWVHDRMSDDERIETTETGPSQATAVAEEALAQKNLDWPEKVADMYTDHFQWNESVEKVQTATVAVADFRRRIAVKRSKEAEAAAQQQAEYQQAIVQETISDVQHGEKRKRDETSDDKFHKKSKTDSANHNDTPVAEHEAQPQHKRDRENLSITMTNLAPSTTQQDVRSFFRDCGTIVSINISPVEGNEATSATVEFELREDFEYARTRSGRMLLDNEVQIHKGSHSTLYVTNYPPEYDEMTIRNLFKTYGDITSVRFPSLKFNNRRRFCYVQFTSYQQAKAAEAAMDGKSLDGTHHLLAKISDPNAKRVRDGAQAEGRELFVKNIDSQASEEEVQTFFEQFGKVVSLRLLKNAGGRRLGNGFIVFSSPEETQKAIEGGNKPLKDRILHVELAAAKGTVDTGSHAHKQDIIVKHDEANGHGARRGSDVSMASSVSHDPESYKTIRERTVALLNVPDTVSHERIIAELEKHGRTQKVSLRRDQHAAVIEFEDINVAAEARNGITFTCLGPECRSADTKELFGNGRKGLKLGAGGLAPSTISRPAQRGGRRGGLGFKRGASSALPRALESSSKPALGNADFKAMLEKGKEES